MSYNVLLLGLVADESRPKPNKNKLIIKLKNNMDKNKTIPPLSQTTVMPSTAIKKCACCGNEIKNKPIKIMHHQINRYVCSEECMWNFYK